MKKILAKAIINMFIATTVLIALIGIVQLAIYAYVAIITTPDGWRLALVFPLMVVCFLALRWAMNVQLDEE